MECTKDNGVDRCRKGCDYSSQFAEKECPNNRHLLRPCKEATWFERQALIIIAGRSSRIETWRKKVRLATRHLISNELNMCKRDEAFRTQQLWIDIEHRHINPASLKDGLFLRLAALPNSNLFTEKGYCERLPGAKRFVPLFSLTKHSSLDSI